MLMWCKEERFNFVPKYSLKYLMILSILLSSHPLSLKKKKWKDGICSFESYRVEGELLLELDQGKAWSLDLYLCFQVCSNCLGNGLFSSAFPSTQGKSFVGSRATLTWSWVNERSQLYRVWPNLLYHNICQIIGCI